MQARIVELETRVAFQEGTLQELNDIVADQQRQLDVLKNEVELLKQQLRGLSVFPLAAASEESPPPHY